MITSPFDDFSQHTLNAVTGTLGKLQYVVGLRLNNGEYFHWGMARTHGETLASLAIAEAHTNLFLVILRTPIRHLWSEIRILALEQNMEASDFIAQLQQHKDLLVPNELQGGTDSHFNSVLLALSRLAEMKGERTGQAA